MDSINSAVDRQMKLEEEMGSLGVHRYLKALEEQGQANNMVGHRLLEQSLSPVIAQLEEFIESTRTGQARNMSATAKYFEMIGVKSVAYIGLRRIINGMSNRDRVVAVAESIGGLLEDEANYSLFNKENPLLMQSIVKRLSGTAANANHRRTVIQGARKNLAKIDGKSFSHDIKIKLGLKLIDFCLAINMVQKVTRSEGKNKSTIYLEPTEKMNAWLESNNSRCSVLTPVYLPMVVKPKPWTTPFDGGYLVTSTSFMKVSNKPYLQELESVDMPILYTGLNAIQETGWRINKAVYNVMRELWDTTGGGLAGLPFKEGKQIPQKPIDIDTNPEALQEWKGKAAATHTHNFKSRSKVIAVVQKLWVAEKFLDEPVIYFPHVLDWRGRAYSLPGFINPQSDDSGKALLQFSEGKPLGASGAAWLAIHLANTYGYDKVDFDDRIVWAEENSGAIIDSALRPLDGERFWLGASKPFQFLAACFEWLGYTMQGEAYESHIAVALDGSCNGLQNYSAMLRDETGGKATNLVPSEKPSDIYQEVANVVQAIIDEDAESGVYEAIMWKQALYKDGSQWVNKPIGRKLTKRNTMTRPYSVTAFGMRDQLIAELDDMIDGGEIKFTGGDDFKLSQVAYYLADKNLQAISQVVVAAEEAMKWLQEVSKVVSSNNLPVIWTTPIGLPVRQHYTTSIAEKMQVFINGVRTMVQYNRQGSELNTRKQSAGIAPNFIHSCDSAHMMRTIDLCVSQGMGSFSMIHDSYGVHPSDTSQLADNLREAFITQYSEDVLGKFRDEISEQLRSSGAEHLIEKLPPMPKFGKLDLEVIRDSEYFFA